MGGLLGFVINLGTPAAVVTTFVERLHLRSLAFWLRENAYRCDGGCYRRGRELSRMHGVN